jgi:hypothetical protein
MVRVELQAKVKGRTASDAFTRLNDLARYPALVEAVRSITVAQEEGRSVSTWEVDFHGGIMRWKEEDVFLPEGGCVVDFWADFDLGIAGLSDVLNPIADSALRENVRGIVSGLLGDAEFVG